MGLGYGFTGEPQTAGGLVCLRDRWWATPRAGAFLTRDRNGGSLGAPANFNSYATARPIRRTTPTPADSAWTTKRGSIWQTPPAGDLEHCAAAVQISYSMQHTFWGDLRVPNLALPSYGCYVNPRRMWGRKWSPAALAAETDVNGWLASMCLFSTDDMTAAARSRSRFTRWASRVGHADLWRTRTAGDWRSDPRHDARAGTEYTSSKLDPSCGKNSFSADTLVATVDGERPISTIQVGDQVPAYDEATHATGYYRR